MSDSHISTSKRRYTNTPKILFKFKPENEVYYFNDVEVSDPNTEYKGGYEWNILWIGGYIAVELNLSRIHYGYASKKEVPNGKDLYGPCIEIEEVKAKNISKRFN